MKNTINHMLIYLFLISVNTHAGEKQPSSNHLFEIGDVIISPGETYRGNLKVSKVLMQSNHSFQLLYIMALILGQFCP
jgi:hypothetical protein